ERCRHVAIVVMIAKDGEHSVRGAQRRKQLRDGTDIRAIGERDVVATENDQVRTCRADEIDGSLHVARRNHRAVMNVGEESDAKTIERQLLSVEQVEADVEGIRAQLARFLDFESTTTAARLVNNAEWLTKLGAVEFMRDVGKHFTVNAMLAKESVRRRIDSDEGI